MERDAGAAGASGTSIRWTAPPTSRTGFRCSRVSMGLCVNRRPVLGVVEAPAVGLVVLGHGHRRRRVLERQADRAVARRSLGGALLVTGFPYARNPVQTNLPEWNAFTAAAQGTRRLGSAALDLCFVACGWLDGYWERALHPWDLVGGAAIVQAAGGQGQRHGRRRLRRRDRADPGQQRPAARADDADPPGRRAALLVALAMSAAGRVAAAILAGGGGRTRHGSAASVKGLLLRRAASASSIGSSPSLRPLFARGADRRQRSRAMAGAGPASRPRSADRARVDGRRSPACGAILAALPPAVDAVVCVAGDMPFLAPALLEHLRDAAPAAPALVPRIAGRAEPLLARYARAVAAGRRRSDRARPPRADATCSRASAPASSGSTSPSCAPSIRICCRSSTSTRPADLAAYQPHEEVLTMPRPRAATVAAAAAVAALALLPFFWSTTFFTDDHLLWRSRATRPIRWWRSCATSTAANSTARCR